MSIYSQWRFRQFDRYDRWKYDRLLFLRAFVSFWKMSVFSFMGGVTHPFSLVSLFPSFLVLRKRRLPIEHPVQIWQEPPQHSCCGTSQIWMWRSNRSFNITRTTTWGASSDDKLASCQLAVTISWHHINSQFSMCCVSSSKVTIWSDISD